MNDAINQLLIQAGKDKALKKRLLATRSDPNPVTALCELATAEGFPLNAMELLNEGESSSAAMLRSVNGGGVEAPEGWDDLYEMFFAALAVM